MGLPGSKRLLVALTLWIVTISGTSAQVSKEKILPLDAVISADGNSIALNWFDARPRRAGSVSIKRRLYDQNGQYTWRHIADDLGPVMQFVDDTIRPGTAYEYQVTRTATDIVDVGYWVTGTEIPAKDRRGTVHLIVDETLAPHIAPRLRRFEQDLIGDGWDVRQVDAPRRQDLPAREMLGQLSRIKQSLHAGQLANAEGQQVIVILGHVPTLRSGNANPDGHTSSSHETDLFFADRDGRWRITQDWVASENSIPSSKIEMQVGRVDFAPVSGGDKDTEIALIQDYLDKNHHWRMGFHGDLRNAYGSSNSLLVEQATLRNIVGPDAITAGGHHDVGESQPWLWGVDFGDWDGASYPEKYANKSVFAINFGSGKQRFMQSNNAMTALLAQPWYPLAVGWGGRPAWWLQHMALGGTIGDVHWRTVNNGVADLPYRETMDYFPTGDYLWRNPIWVNLLGDPTLRAFPQKPPTNLQALRDASGSVQLTWDAPSSGAMAYRLYRAAPDSNRFEPVELGPDQRDTRFTDDNRPEGTRYMIRAESLTEVYAGSFYNLSQGQFATLNATQQRPRNPPPVKGVQDRAVKLPEAFSKASENLILSIIAPPEVGQLTRTDAGWTYTPEAGFTGITTLRYAIWNGSQSVARTLDIEILPD